MQSLLPPLLFEQTSVQAGELEIDERIYQCYLGLLPRSGPYVSSISKIFAHVPLCRAPGSSNADNRLQICGRGLPINQPPSLGSYLTHYWRSTGQNSGKPCPIDAEELDDISEYQTLTLFESQNLIEGGTTGLRTWPASLLLARYLSLYTGTPNSGAFSSTLN
jgi:hypothetical protein